jgi:hypothetical protein
MEALYVWEPSFLLACLETDGAELPKRIEEARALLDTRIQKLTSADSEERIAINNALHSLRMLWIERCQGQGCEFDQIVKCDCLLVG